MKVYRNKKAGENIIRTYDALIKAWGIEVEELDINTPYGTTHVIAAGDENNPPLMLFHGVGDDSALMWIYNAKFLSEYFRIYAIDTIGGPGKSRPNENYNKKFDDIVWIDSILENLKLSKAFFAGVSNGGYLTKLYTAKRPEKIIKALSISAAISTEDSENQITAMMKIFLPEALFPTKKNVTKLIKKLSGINYAVFTENETIMEHYTYLLRGFNNMAMTYHNVRAFDSIEVDIIREKTVFLLGLEDPFVKFGGKETIEKNSMKAFFYEGAGHGLNHEKAEEINKKIVEILLNKI